MVDYDNAGLIPDRVYLGTFWLEADEINVLEMRHYCEIRTQCPELEWTQNGGGCFESFNSVHFETAGGLCLEAA